MSYDLEMRGSSDYRDLINEASLRVVIAKALDLPNNIYLHWQPDPDDTSCWLQVNLEQVMPSGDIFPSPDKVPLDWVDKVNCARIHISRSQYGVPWMARRLALLICQKVRAEFGWQTYDPQLDITLEDQRHPWPIEWLPQARTPSCTQYNQLQNRLLLAGRNFAQIWDLRNGAMIWSESSEELSYSGCWLPQKDQLLLLRGASNRVVQPYREMDLIDLHNRVVLFTQQIAETEQVISTSHGDIFTDSEHWRIEGNRLIKAGVHPFKNPFVISEKGELAADKLGIWSLDSKERIVQFPRDHSVSSLAFSEDSRHLASAGWEKRILIWDIVQRRVTRELTRCGEVRTLFWLSSSSLLSGSCDSPITRLWDVKTEKSKTLRAPGSPLIWEDYAIPKFLPNAKESGRDVVVIDGDSHRLIIVTTSDGRITFWDQRDLQWSAVLSVLADGRWLVVAPSSHYDCSKDFSELQWCWVTDARKYREPFSLAAQDPGMYYPDLLRDVLSKIVDDS